MGLFGKNKIGNGIIGRGMGTEDFLRHIPLLIIPLPLLFGATRHHRVGFGEQAKCAHLRILAEMAKNPATMNAGFFEHETRINIGGNYCQTHTCQVCWACCPNTISLTGFEGWA